MNPYYQDEQTTIYNGDCREILQTLPDDSVDAVVTDPPYGLAFMGKRWDYDVPSIEVWAECLRILKPGGHLLAFAGTRTQHRMAVRIEDAGFEIRDQIGWLYGSGFPKSHDVSKGIDKMLGAQREVVGTVKLPGYGRSHVEHGVQKRNVFEFDKTTNEPASEAAREWQGWGTALKPACEPIAFARKPLGEKTVAANVLAHGTGALNIDRCRIEGESTRRNNTAEMGYHGGNLAQEYQTGSDLGRWPANIIHDGSDEVVSGFPESESGGGPAAGTPRTKVNTYGEPTVSLSAPYGANSGSAARFFYSAKADADDRIGSNHPTVKPVDLMRWLCRLVTPKGGTILDPFAGTGTTGAAAYLEGFNAILIEREAEYQADIARRMALLLAGPDEKARESLKARGKVESAEALPLFGGIA